MITKETKITLAILLVILSVIIVIFSIGIAAKANSQNDLHNLAYGFPIPFLFSDQSLIYSGFEGDYPHRLIFGMDFLDRDFTISFHPLDFIFSVLIVWSVAIIIWFILNRFASINH